jgi:hypothetical protein
MKSIKYAAFYHFVNFLITIVLNDLYEWQGKYFFLAFTSYLIPNLIGVCISFCFVLIFQKISFNVVKFILPISFFISNELSYLIFENQWMFFGLFPNEIPSNVNEVNKIYYILISTSGLLSSVITYSVSLRANKNEPESNGARL